LAVYLSSIAGSACLGVYSLANEKMVIISSFKFSQDESRSVAMHKETHAKGFTGASQYVLDDELARIVNISMALEMPLLLKGEPGTGKTAVTRYVLRELTAKFGELQLPFKAVYLNCRNVDTDYRVLARICAELGQKVPFTGLPTDEVHSRLVELLESQDLFTIIVFGIINIITWRNI
jgi:Cdc6-like AAA superfamily ATPase